jgi:hypothetical protein
VEKSSPQDQETVTLSQAKALIKAMAGEQSILFLSPPGLGKSDTVRQAAQESGLPLRSLLGTQIAPEDVSGVPRIIGERSVFCPPRVLLPEASEPFCLFLDELPACSPDVQKAFYSLLLERRIGEHRLPTGSWVVAAGNRSEDRALVRALSTALVNRVFMIHVRPDANEWLRWAHQNGVRPEILAFIAHSPTSLLRPIPDEPAPFSTPRAWASLSRALDLADQAGLQGRSVRRALAFGRLSAEDAAVFSALLDEGMIDLHPAAYYVENPYDLPSGGAALWFLLHSIRRAVETDDASLQALGGEKVNEFLDALPKEHRFALFVGLVERWGRLGANQALLDALLEVTGP